jgi:hypothetical protein
MIQDQMTIQRGPSQPTMMVQAIEMQALIRAFSLMLRERVDETAGERLTTAVTCKPRMT